MSKLLRLPLTLLAVLAAMLFLPGIAWGDPLTPSAAQCAASPGLEGCAPAQGGTTVEEPTSDPAPGNGGGTTGQQPGGRSTDEPAGSPLVVPFQVPAQAQ